MHLPRRSCDEVGALLMMTSCCPQTRSRSRGNPRSLSLSPTLSPPTPSSSPSLSTSFLSVFSILYIPPLLHCLSSLLDFINTHKNVSNCCIYHRFTGVMICVMCDAVWCCLCEGLHITDSSLHAPERLSSSPPSLRQPPPARHRTLASHVGHPPWSPHWPAHKLGIT